MAMQVAGASDKKRVKVYELKENDWFDRGTGFCTGQIINVRGHGRVMQYGRFTRATTCNHNS